MKFQRTAQFTSSSYKRTIQQKTGLSGSCCCEYSLGMEAHEITTAGVYWYFDAIGGDAVAVEVGPAESAEVDWEVRFFGREDPDRLLDVSGQFRGPIERPARPAS